MIDYGDLTAAMAETELDKDEAAFFKRHGFEYEALGRTAAWMGQGAISHLELRRLHGPFDMNDVGAAVTNAFLCGAQVALRALEQDQPGP